MQEAYGYFNNFQVILNLIKDIVQQKTAPGTNHEYGVTVEEILREINRIQSTMYSTVPQITQQDVAHALSFQMNGFSVFDSFTSNDNTVYWKLSNPPEINPPLFEQQFGRQEYPYPGDQIAPALESIEQPIPHTYEELEKEIALLQKKQKELEKKNESLQVVYRLLQNPVLLDEVTSKIDSNVFSLRETYTMVDEKVSGVLSFLESELSDPK